MWMTTERTTRAAIATSLGVMLVIGAASAAHARSYAGCGNKRSYQQAAVRQIVHAWFEGTARPDALIELVQAEQGIAACDGPHAARMHTTRLPRGLAPDQLGGLLLANEIEWSGLMPTPEAALAGELFRIAPPTLHAPSHGKAARGDARE